MEKEFIPYEQALALKELGFDEPCFGIHSKIHGLMMFKTSGSSSLYKDAGECLAPLYSQAFRWFREKHDLDVISRPHIGKSKKYICDPVNIRLEAKNTYEEAELECLKKLIQIIKEKL